jgi:hypothetical protein
LAKLGFATDPRLIGHDNPHRLREAMKTRAPAKLLDHGSKVPLRTWLFVLFEMCASENGLAAREIERKYHVAPKTAWFIALRA